ncbi:MAG: MopE-related protein [Myxococcota bacterium]
MHRGNGGRRALIATALLATVLTVSGCTITTRTRPMATQTTVRVQTPVPQPQPQPQPVVVQQQPQLAQGVTIVESTCTQGAQEVCNGLDDNCNGQIDEGCGYQSGNIQVTLAWNSGADLDMYVRDPMGNTLSYENRQSSTGGFLDQDARGACEPGQPNNTIENVFWNQANPPQGTYDVMVNYWSGSTCSTNAGPTNLTLSISVGGQVIGSYAYTIQPNQRLSIAQFQI